MAAVQQLRISCFRNISSAAIQPCPGINVITGINGSGKTSLLEAIYLLGLGRSFRTRQLKSIVQQSQSQFALFARLQSQDTLGFSRSIDSALAELKVSGKPAQSISQLAQLLPLQLFNTDTFCILEGSPSDRRAFIDWGVFHVEHRFYQMWRQCQHALKQRNMLLKTGASTEMIRPWTLQFVSAAEQIDIFRDSYTQALIPVFTTILERLMPGHAVTLVYDRGWDTGGRLEDVIQSSLERDKRYGHTGHGPHRADLKCFIGGSLAVERLSRGQQKLVVSALKIAQGQLLTSVKNERCLYLVDDLPSELDTQNRAKLCRALVDTGSQVFITSIYTEDLLPYLPVPESELGLFHVKHGKIEQ